MHGSAQLEAQRYKQQISEVSHVIGGHGGVQGRGLWMCGGRDGAERGGRYGRGGRRGGQIQIMINSVDVLNPTRNFRANEWTILG